MKLFGRKIIILNKDEHEQLNQSLNEAKDQAVSAAVQIALARAMRLLGSK